MGGGGKYASISLRVCDKYDAATQEEANQS